MGMIEVFHKVSGTVTVDGVDIEYVANIGDVNEVELEEPCDMDDKAWDAICDEAESLAIDDAQHQIEEWDRAQVKQGLMADKATCAHE